MTWVAAGVAAGSAILGYYGSQQASAAQANSAKQNRALSQQQYANSLLMTEPGRYMGYQAMSDLSHLYGWGTQGYAPLSQLQYGAGTGGGGNLDGSKGTQGGGMLNPNNVIGGGSLFGRYVGGGTQKRYGGTIDPATGTVDVANGHSFQDEALTHYLRTGEWTLTGKKSNELKAQIDRLRASGWTFDPTTGKGTFPGATQGEAPGQPGQMDRFFTTPDYQYTFDQAMRGNDRSAAARGGALSGNAITRNTTTAANLGAGQYQNYVNNLFRAMGYGDTANANAQNAGNTLVANVGNANTAIGDARATGIANGYGAAIGGLNSLGSIYGNYLGSQSPSSLNPYGSYGTASNALSGMTPSYAKIPELYPQGGIDMSRWT